VAVLLITGNHFGEAGSGKSELNFQLIVVRRSRDLGSLRAEIRSATLYIIKIVWNIKHPLGLFQSFP